MPAARSRVRLDLNSPEFQDAFFRLEIAELRQVVASLGRLRELDWNTLYRHTGFQMLTAFGQDVEIVVNARPRRRKHESIRVVELHVERIGGHR